MRVLRAALGAAPGAVRLRCLAACLGVLLLTAGCSRPQSAHTATAPPPPVNSRTVVFVHGMYMTPLCWQAWEGYFRERGYKTLAPAWPLHDAPIAAQRQGHPSQQLGALTLDQILASYRSLLGGLPEKPILIGHSMGGLVVQLLLAEGLGVAGVAIDSAPPKGLLSFNWSFVKSNWPVLTPSADLGTPIELTFSQFQYAFANGLSEAEQGAAFAKYVVPESRRVGKGPTTDVAKIDYGKPRPPLLLVAGENDHIIPASLNYSNYRLYADTPAVTAYREFAGRSHWIIADSGWQEVAAYIVDWLHGSAPP